MLAVEGQRAGEGQGGVQIVDVAAPLAVVHQDHMVVLDTTQSSRVTETQADMQANTMVYSFSRPLDV